MEKKKIYKKRNWAFVAYPESLSEDWINELTLSGLPVAVSPLHDKDINETGEGKGELKKEHYHIIVSYSGPTSFDVVKKLTDKINAVHPIPLEQVQGMYRYQIHKDNPEKYQYDDKDRILINGFEIKDFVELKKSEVLKIKNEIQLLIRDADIIEYCDLMDLLQDNDFSDYYDIASCHTYFFEKYISSRRNKRIPKK